MKLEDQIESAIQQALGNLQVNNIVLSVKLEVAEARVAELEQEISGLKVPLDEMADRDLAAVDGHQ